MAAALEIVERRIGPVIVLELSGRLVVDDGERSFREHVRTLVSAGQMNIVVDLSGITYLDSGGVGALAAMYVHVARRGGRMKLLCPSSRSCRVLEITHLMEVFEIFEREQDAIASFEAPSVTPGTAREGLIAR